MKAHRTVTMTFLRETAEARMYRAKDGREHWIPRTLVKHTSKRPDGTHVVTVEAWKAEELDL